jgi:regulator of protease activity HflC (stomatin/prohibitin superfamily)
MLDQGLRTKMPFVQTVVKMDTRTQKYEASATSASQDLQDVSTTIALNYRLREEAAADVYKTLGINYIDKIASPAIHETVKQITAKFIAEDLILRRDEVKARITETLYNRLSERGIEVEIVSITDFRFSSTFTAAIEAKVAAEQAVLEAENKLKRVRVEAEQREAEAKGEANARIAQALGEAQYIETVTAAQVAANKAINETLTPEVLQYILLDRLGDDIKLIVVPSNSDLGLVLPQISP